MILPVQRCDQQLSTSSCNSEANLFDASFDASDEHASCFARSEYTLHCSPDWTSRNDVVQARREGFNERIGAGRIRQDGQVRESDWETMRDRIVTISLAVPLMAIHRSWRRDIGSATLHLCARFDDIIVFSFFFFLRFIEANGKLSQCLKKYACESL